MEARKPVWTLKRLCPICGQGSSLTLLACSDCEKVVVACEEEGTVFLNPQDLSQQQTAWSSFRSYVTDCSGCEQNSEFRVATSDEAQRAGFQPGEYE